MSDVIAKRVDAIEQCTSPGDFFWTGDRLMFNCPCGCGSIGGIAVGGNPGEHPVWKFPIWKWDGNTDTPTVTPSIRFMSGCQWHGFLTAGVFRSA